MRPPQGLSLRSPHLIYKLEESFYGLKQAPRTWFIKLTTVQVTFQQSQHDTSFLKMVSPWPYSFSCIY